MKIKLTKNQLGGMTPAAWLRQVGYSYIVDHNSGQESYARRLGGDFYPRFHLYIQQDPGSGELVFNIHLDQKKASYVGQARHSGEYEGELVGQETARLQSYLQPAGSTARVDEPQRSAGSSERDILNTFRPRQMTEQAPPKKSWWQRLFS